MNNNIIEYLKWRGDLSFEQDCFNTIDAEILAQLSYNKIYGLVSENFEEQITIKELAQKFVKTSDYEQRKNLGALINPLTVDLLISCGKSTRFGNIKICALREILDFEKTEQFVAMAFIYNNDIYVTFRGTDDYIVGWREDFNIAFIEPAPCQADGLLYLKQAADFFKENITVIGHSKGGNIGLYSASSVDEKVQKKIVNVYNLDGPGFKKDFFSSEGYLRIKNKVISIYPACDIVGMLFNHDSNYQIVKSNGKGVIQHDIFEWQLCGHEIIKAKNFTEDSKIFEKAFNEWCDNLSQEDKKKFVNAIFDVFEASGYRTLYEISKNSLRSSKNMIEAYAELPAPTKTAIRRICQAFLSAVKVELPVFNFLK